MKNKVTIVVISFFFLFGINPRLINALAPYSDSNLFLYNYFISTYMVIDNRSAEQYFAAWWTNYSDKGDERGWRDEQSRHPYYYRGMRVTEDDLFKIINLGFNQYEYVTTYKGVHFSFTPKNTIRHAFLEADHIKDYALNPFHSPPKNNFYVIVCEVNLGSIISKNEDTDICIRKNIPPLLINKIFIYDKTKNSFIALDIDNTIQLFKNKMSAAPRNTVMNEIIRCSSL